MKDELITDDEKDKGDTEEEYFDCLETFDIEVEPSFHLPYVVAEAADPACILLDKLIREGKLSKKSFFYKNMFEVAKHLENDDEHWDPEICEALISIKHLGGKATMNYVVGPLSRGQGRKGPVKDLSPVLNYGGPSSFVLQKYVPGNMQISGISKHLQLSVLRLLDLSEVVTINPTSHLFSVSLEMDGTMVKAGLSWDNKLGFAVGCQDPLTYQDLLEMNFKLPVTEVDVCVLSSLCSNVTLSLGYILQSNSGKTGLDIVEKYTQVIKTASKCEACVMAKPAQLNTIPLDTLCDSFCPECWTVGTVCAECCTKGRNTIYPQLESCFQCLEKGIVCKKIIVHILALDCFTGNRFLMEKFQEDLLNGKKDPELFF